MSKNVSHHPSKAVLLQGDLPGRRIDQAVYEPYGLTEEEIEIVEGKGAAK